MVVLLYDPGVSFEDQETRSGRAEKDTENRLRTPVTDYDDDCSFDWKSQSAEDSL